MNLDRKEGDSITSASHIDIPVTLFADRSLSIFEVLVEYLKEKFTLHQIAVLTNRDDRTIWTVYARAKEKRKTHHKPQILSTTIFVPLSVLLDRRLAVLEVIVVYLKERLNLKFSQIAELINRNQRTIWTVYNRTRKKLGSDKK